MSYNDLLQQITSKIKGKVALSFSYQAEDVVVLHLLLQCGVKSLEVFTLDTGKHFPQSEEFHKEVEEFFGITIKRYLPNQNSVKSLEKKLGLWGMRDSLENRHLCCHIRKVEPLKRALKNKSAWVTGLRASQSVTRSDLKIVEFDENFSLFKINPIAFWSEKQTFDYIKEYNLPLNSLYHQGFKSIGCAPCTRAVGKDDDVRSGRWWWEEPEHKECGLHIKEKA
ncbi:MAG: phosphoadenylyl-sulfate reductase [Campylobacteraceae bacterium]|jgi:phosphoadenosine phosphosulfate reductase|nr:phosphoadenylyl-sulfate reductase [Campylobacteraceae bacterium]